MRNVERSGTVTRLHFDCTYTRLSRAKIGITRVVGELASELLALEGEGAFRTDLVAWSPEGFRVLPRRRLADAAAGEAAAPGWVSALLRLADRRSLRAAATGMLTLEAQRALWRLTSRNTYGKAARRFPLASFRSGDVFFSIDAAWNYDARDALQAARAAGARVVTGIHDLIPVSHPEYCLPLVSRVFEDWLRSSAEVSDAYVGNSETTAGELRAWLARAGRDIPVSSFRLGASALAAGSGGPVRRFVSASESDHTFISVGSIDPRKNHDFILDAFEMLWRSHPESTLLVIGAPADGSRRTVRRIRRHRLFGKRLRWITDCEDRELDHLYRTANATIIASAAEGFGLPLVEARQRGARVLASDIPALREVSDDAVRFFALNSPASLAALLRDLLETRPPLPGAMPSFDWRDSARELQVTIARLCGG